VLKNIKQQVEVLKMSRKKNALTAVMMLGITALVSGPARAAELNIYWDRLLQPGGGYSDLLTDGGGSTTTGLMLQSGVNEAANAYHVSYPDPNDPSFTPYSDLASLAGGTVSYGYISGVVTTSVSTTAFLGLGNGPNAFARFNASWTDTLTIMPANPALIGQPGILSGSVLVDTGGSVNAVGSSAPNVEASASVTGIFSVNGVNTFDFSLTVGDEFSPIGSIPPSTLVPISVGFIFW
jgi:hypothetical protein